MIIGLKHLYPWIAVQLQSFFENGPPEWMTVGTKVLLVKDKSESDDPSNFRPNTSLPTT